MRDSPLFIEFVVSQSKRSEDNPCKRLLWGILVDVFYVRDHAFTTRMKKQLARDLEWIQSDDDKPFTFVWLCQQLELDPDWVQRAYATCVLVARFPQRYAA